MAAWVIWAIVAVGLAVGEILTPGMFFLGPVALAAVAAAGFAAAGAGGGFQLGVFIAASVASLAVLRPIARRHLRMPARLRTGTAALVGARGVAVERIDLHGGRVKIGGEVWTARAFDETQVIEPGARVEIVKIEGATALVYE
jgi:membrane protein implicated in regulation of membrane protease activity